jgi:predicted TIM-barrel enzyme
MSDPTARLSVELEPFGVHGEEKMIFAPALALFPSALARAATTFPLCNTNQVTMEYLKANNARAPENCYCAIFALDPFLNWDEFSALLHAAKFRGICNFPTVPEFDGEESNALAASDYTYEAELRHIKSYAGNQFSLLVAYSSDVQRELAKKLAGDGMASYCHVDKIAEPLGPLI